MSAEDASTDAGDASLVSRDAVGRDAGVTGARGAGAVGSGAGGTDAGGTATVRVVLPAHLRRLAGVDGEVRLDIGGEATQRVVLDELEARYPMLRGTIRDHATQRRRAFVRFFACEDDLSHDPPDSPLPAAVSRGAEPFLVVGAMAGG
jgi:molybdopterin synthase sulfur carrier subunit